MLRLAQLAYALSLVYVIMTSSACSPTAAPELRYPLVRSWLDLDAATLTSDVVQQSVRTKYPAGTPLATIEQDLPDGLTVTLVSNVLVVTEFSYVFICTDSLQVSLQGDANDFDEVEVLERTGCL